jgi:hypothetical protein
MMVLIATYTSYNSGYHVYSLHAHTISSFVKRIMLCAINFVIKMQSKNYTLHRTWLIHSEEFVLLASLWKISPGIHVDRK